MRVALVAAFALHLTVSAQAPERFVDVDSGSDSNDGLSPATAWRTLTHAFDVADAGTHPGYQVLRVAPGYYVEGVETMPLSPPSHVRVVGDPAERPVVESLTGAVFEYDGLRDFIPPETTVLEGFEIRVAPSGVGIRLVTEFNSIHPTIRDVVIRGGAAGIWMRGASALVERALIEDGDVGIDLGFEARLFLDDSEIRACAIGLLSTGDSDSTVDRCVVRQCGTGVEAHASFPDTGTNTIRNSLLVENTGFGVDNSADGHVVLENVTVAGNDVGLHAKVVIGSSIVWGNALDASDPDSEASFSIVGDPVTCIEGCLSVDPLFVDAAESDYRLAFGSPAADTGAHELTSFDLLGTERPVDGDLETTRRADMGAFELTPLALPEGAAPGESLDFELWGEPGAVSLLFAALGPPVPPLPTAFGLLELDPVSALYLGLASPAPGPPGGASVPVPARPKLSGITLSFQAVTSSPAPSGGAWTNVIATSLD